MGIPNKGGGGGGKDPHAEMPMDIGHIIDLEKMYCRCLNFDSLALGFYPDAGFLFYTLYIH